MATISAITAMIGVFDCTQEDWLTYTERLQHFFTANGIKADKQVSLRSHPVSPNPFVGLLSLATTVEANIFLLTVDLRKLNAGTAGRRATSLVSARVS